MTTSLGARTVSRCVECRAYPCVCRAQTSRLMPSLRPISEECACGGPDIVARTRLESDVTAAVDRHQVEPLHIAWRAALGLDQPIPLPAGIEHDLRRELTGARR